MPVPGELVGVGRGDEAEAPGLRVGRDLAGDDHHWHVEVERVVLRVCLATGPRLRLLLRLHHLRQGGETRDVVQRDAAFRRHERRVAPVVLLVIEGDLADDDVLVGGLRRRVPVVGHLVVQAHQALREVAPEGLPLREGLRQRRRLDGVGVGMVGPRLGHLEEGFLLVLLGLLRPGGRRRRHLAHERGNGVLLLVAPHRLGGHGRAHHLLGRRSGARLGHLPGVEVAVLGERLPDHGAPRILLLHEELVFEVDSRWHGQRLRRPQWEGLPGGVERHGLRRFPVAEGIVVADNEHLLARQRPAALNREGHRRLLHLPLPSQALQS
mmetsp:Transcript_48321/g.136570  ORF Transcript_48321/g.136570 Transcript_48321/m.136570 type:complete len:324 (+) Transcript_48321:701-1672(+)